MNYTYKYIESGPIELRTVLKANPELHSLVLDENPSMSVVAFYGEQPIGLVRACKRDEENVRVATVFVNVVHWGKGVGSKLLTMLEEAAKEKGFDTLSLTVYEKNSRAKGLYEKLGFAKTGVLVTSFETWMKCIN